MLEDRGAFDLRGQAFFLGLFDAADERHYSHLKCWGAAGKSHCHFL